MTMSFFGDLGERKRLGAADDGFAVELRKRQLYRHAARRDDDVFGFDFLCLAGRRFDGDLAGRGDRSETLERRHLVRFHQRADAAVHRFHDLVLALKHLREIDRNVVDHDAMFGRFLFCEHDVVARGEQRLARNAADVETGAAEILFLFDNRGLESELAGADGGYITARTGANDDNVKFFHKSFQRGARKRSVPSKILKNRGEVLSDPRCSPSLL